MKNSRIPFVYLIRWEWAISREVSYRFVLAVKGEDKMDVLAINARLGDGTIAYTTENKVSARLKFQSKQADWLGVKRDLAKALGYGVSSIRLQKSGYTGKYDIHIFDTKTKKELVEFMEIPTIEVIKSLQKRHLVMWYLDDGSYHKTRHTMHLYCNMLSAEELEALVNQISFLYGHEPRPRIDRKKDGREFPYLYFGRKLTEAFRLDVEKFINAYKIESMRYKIGEAQPIRKTFNDYPTAYKKR